MSRKALITALVSMIAMPAAGAIYAHAQVQTDPQNFDVIEKGRYLTTAADCSACHTVPGGAAFAGGRPLETPFGNIVSTNITPNPETGIGAWTDDQFDNAVRRGMRRDGSRLYPAMPYQYYAKMSRDDVLAIRAYLNTITPVHNRVVSNTLPFPFNIRAGMKLWDWAFFDDAPFKPEKQKSEEWNRGKYLVDGAGHCGACHTPKNFAGGDENGSYLQGYNLQGWFAPDITNDARAGLGHWTVDDIVVFLKTGHNRVSAAVGPMAEEVTHASAGMTDSDLRAMAIYLKDLPGHSTPSPPVPGTDPQMVAGAAIYRDQCSACHQMNGEGVPRLFPSLADSSIARSGDPQSLVHLILKGARSAATNEEPTAPGMPSYGRQLNDAQIAAVATYIRNQWADSAPAVSSSEVADLRAALAESGD